MVIVDRLKKWATFVPCTKKITAVDVTELFFNRIGFDIKGFDGTF